MFRYLRIGGVGHWKAGGAHHRAVYSFRFASMISISNLGRSFGDRTLFAGVSIQLNRGERYGLVGANGSGKTTLLNILSGEMDATEGHASVPKDVFRGMKSTRSEGRGPPIPIEEAHPFRGKRSTHSEG